jgi:hypothetical protein
MKRLLAVGLGLLTLNGCYAHHGGAGNLAFAFLAGAAIAAAENEPPPPPEREVVYVPVPAGPPIAAPPPIVSPAETLREPEHAAAFDAVAMRTALGSVDLHACREKHGAPNGFGHAKVSFATDGSITRVVIDRPAGLSADAVSCIGDALGTVHVAPFSGGAMTAGYVFHVE